MANIPAPGLPDVAPQPLPTPYQSPGIMTPDAFGAPAGRSLERVGVVTHELYQQEKHYADTAAVLGAEAQAKQALNTIILDDQKGYRSLKGIDAVAGREDALRKFNQAVQDAGAGLTNDAQRMFYQQRAQTIQEQGFHYALSHEVTEQDRYAVGNFRGNVDQTMVTMQNPAVISNPDALRAQIDSLFQTGIEEARRRYGEGASKAAIQDVVVPELQKAARGAMQAAVAASETTGDPSIAKNAFDTLGRYLVTGEHRDFGRVIAALSAKTAIDAGARDAMSKGVTVVMMPDGTQVPRPDPTQISAAINSIAQDNPYRDQIVDAVRKRENDYTKLWDANAARVAANALTSGQLRSDGTTGPFDMDRVSESTKVWLAKYAPEKLIALRKEDARAQRAATGQDKLDSAQNYSDALTTLYDPAQKDRLLGTSMEQFQASLLDEQQYPGGFTPQDRAKLTKSFAVLQKQNFDEKIGTTVRDELRKAYEDQDERDKRFGELNDRAQIFSLQYQRDNGRPPKTEEVRKYVVEQLMVEPGSGLFGGTFGGKRRIDLPRAVPTTAATPVAPPAAPEGRVRVISPNGQHGSVPASQLDDLLKQGYRRE